ncbi:BTAD domain-containing putative transcriptional regulator [Streptomyces coacervatus]|uniref:BTAD domain-containing putative transcriptional regulator n=1 Tax=Streptomyces coacervatus TaxID=647381 RepID=A0ABP7HSU9_9ACTN|nr:AfsR/SARP family transcriptional regulator [Streptomyces coacervatus]MDF2270626.1 BTAD domain-containing putative transcriptional regulator [Streptomyces coacervatus]
MGGVRRCGLRFGLLGPPVLYDVQGEVGESAAAPAGIGDTDVKAIGSPKVRTLLAALLLEAGRVVSVDSLKDALWGGAPPASAQASLHNHVARLRRLLDDPERLRAVPPGYVLRVEQGELDVHVFERHLATARGAYAARNWERVVRECTSALALWRGTPLSGLPAELGGYAFVQRLKEARLLLLEWRYDAELAVGGARLDGLVPELAALTAEHPLREAYHRQLMLALHRTGRQAEALAVHRDLRTRLVEELGVEPGQSVREAHTEVLRTAPAPAPAHGPALAEGEEPPQGPPAPDDESSTGGAGGTPNPAEGRVPAHTPAPAQLPPPPPHFTGRTPEQTDLQQTLLNRRSHPAVLSGMAGVGKSALALQVAHDLRERFPDGQLYINLHGATPGMTPLTPAQALTALLRDLGTEPRRIPEHPDAAAALLRSLLAPTRTLLLLDDAANAAQVRPLLPAGAGCAVIVTSRSPLTALDGARRFPLTPLGAEESAELLRAVSGRGALDASHALVELTGRLPLALRIVAARLAARQALTPDVLAGQLAATEGRLHHLEYDDLSVRRSLAVAHDALAASEREADRDAALVLRGIGALDLPAYGAPLLAHLVGTDARRAEAALDRLVDVALLEETAYGRYAPHDLVRDFARELAGDASDIDAALPWYAAVAERTLTAIVEPGLDQDDRRRPTAAQPPDHAAHVAALPTFESSEQAFAWGDTELLNIVTLVERYADDSDHAAGTDGQAKDQANEQAKDQAKDQALRAARISTLIRLFFPYVLRSGRVAEMEVLGRAALRMARRLGDEAAEAYALGDLAGLHFLTGRQSEALTLNDRALTIWRRLDHVSWMRRCLNNRGLLLEGLGRYEESGWALRQSLEYSRRLDDPYGEAVTRSHLGNLYEHTDPRAAIEQHRRSLAIGDEIGAVIVQHSAHCNIGYAHLTLGEPAAAVPHFEESLCILGGHGDWHGESQTRLGLVRALRLLGRTERAEDECAELLRRADARADRFTGGLARHQQGLLLRERGRAEEAYGLWSVALDALDGTDESAVVAELRELLGQADIR